MSRRALLAIAAAMLIGCRVASEPGEAPDIPDGVRVQVEIEGRELGPITSAGLRAAAPTYLDRDHRAWRLADVLPAHALKAGMQLDVEESSGQRTILTRLGAGPAEPVLMVNRKGQVLVALVEPSDPFPAFHGRGGNRGQSGRANRIRDVVRLRLTSP